MNRPISYHPRGPPSRISAVRVDERGTLHPQVVAEFPEQPLAILHVSTTGDDELHSRGRMLAPSILA